jgi:chemotaxis protein histidine kinase CheA
MVGFVKSGIERVLETLESVDAASLDEIPEVAKHRWADYLVLLRPEIEDEWLGEILDDFAPSQAQENEAFDDQVKAEQINVILKSLENLVEADRQDGAPPKPKRGPVAASQPGTPGGPTTPPTPEQVDVDREAIEAFIDDATKCLAVIEQSVLQYEARPDDPAALAQVCRQLHTLKGASGAIGLHALASYLHHVEDRLEECCRQTQTADVELILGSVDVVRQQLATFAAFESEPPASKAARRITITAHVDLSDASVDSIRVKTTQLDRLLDMLAELVMLRNRRQSQVDSLTSINAEVLKCVSRLRAYEERYPIGLRRQMIRSNAESNELVHAGRTSSVSSLTEIANDLLELARGLRNTFDPIAEENRVLSRFIHQFRGELIELRRLPISGLFHRLQRAARDAAKTENKQVETRFVNEHIGLERCMHDKLFEPLLHMVRNAVSHGIESPDQRVSKGKPPCGTITLEARVGASVFIVDVKDDGRGLDYEALRRRGLQKGLLSPDRQYSRDELGKLIFEPGFSTREEINEISGRGVGMDVVAAAVDAMGGWVELESNPGAGTCFRVYVPRPSLIEHAMVFQLGGQYFAVPTHCARSTLMADTNESLRPEVPSVDLAALLGTSKAGSESQIIIVESQGSDVRCEETCRLQIGLVVDSVIGPEEVVVRPLPALLKSHRLFSGVTLAGSGDIMLLLDTQALIELASSRGDGSASSPLATRLNEAKRNRGRIMVVDDSVSSRRALSNVLRNHVQLDIDQVADGAEAIQLLREKKYVAVFTDLDMPRLTGLELIHEMQLDSALNHIPVTVVTSREDDQSREMAIQAGAVRYLVKPADESVVEETIRFLQLK